MSADEVTIAFYNNQISGRKDAATHIVEPIINGHSTGVQRESIMDSIMISTVSDCAHSKLKIAQIKGYAGWWNKKECSDRELERRMEHAIQDGDYLSVVNYASMLFMRQNVIPMKY